MGLVKTKRPAGMKPQMKSGAGNGVQHVPRGRRPSREAGAMRGAVCAVRVKSSAESILDDKWRKA